MDIDQVIKQVSDSLAKNNTNVVFGETREFKEKAIIPVGSMKYGFGGGGGKGKKRKEGEEEGKGLGGGAKLNPLGYILITPEGVTFKPVYDLNVVIYAFVAMCLAMAMKHMVKKRMGNH